GQPTGDEGKYLASFCGLMVRRKIPINIDNWTLVPTDLKDAFYGALIDLPRLLISTFVAKAYHDTWNQGALVGIVKGLSRHL
ncbi:hypothetical protein PanWU01x14_255110, partial [Parasponia andersonii]